MTKLPREVVKNSSVGFSVSYCLETYFCFLKSYSFFPRENPGMSPPKWKKYTGISETLTKSKQRTAQVK